MVLKSNIEYELLDKELRTIEKFIIFQKIERVKELVSYNELNFSEIAFKVNYSSIAHLSNNSNLLPETLSQYKATQIKERNRLDKVK